MRYARPRYAVAAFVAAALAAIVALGVSALALQHGASTAFADGLLRIESEITYDVRPDSGPVSVEWDVELENNDPSTQARDFGTVFFYESVSLPILSGASGVQATGPNGGPLFVSVQGTDNGTVDVATVSFDHELYFGDQYAFTLSYDLTGARSDALLVTEAYVYIPAIVAGDASRVFIVTSSDPAWAVTVEPFQCAFLGGGSFRCGGSEDAQVAAFVEVTRPDALRSIDASAPLAAGDINLTIGYYPGEEAWAEHIRELTISALPALEDLFGFPYDGSRRLSIAERGRQEIAGYEGTFGCRATGCIIGISPVADDHTALHELAHLWTQRFEKRWLAEGLAEFMSERAADELGSLAGPRDAYVPDTVALQLDEWGQVQYLIGAGEDDLRREDTGYYESRRFFELLEETVGLQAIQGANAAAVELSGVDSKNYLDLLEEASGARLDTLFLDDVFPESFAPVLEQRRSVRAQASETRAVLEAEGFGLPERVDTMIAAWKFDSAQELLDEASRALDSYASARDAVDGSRSFWTKIGLLGQDPDRALRDANASMRDADYARAQERAEQAESIIDGAGRNALIRVLAGTGILALVVLVVGGFWFVRART